MSPNEEWFSKGWFESKSIWFFTFFAAVVAAHNAGVLDLPIADPALRATVDQWAVFVGALIGIALRLTTSTPISGTQAADTLLTKVRRSNAHAAMKLPTAQPPP